MNIPSDRDLMATELEIHLVMAKFLKSGLTFMQSLELLTSALNTQKSASEARYIPSDVGPIVYRKHELKYYIWYLLESGLTQYQLVKKFRFSTSQVTREVNGEVDLKFQFQCSANTPAVYEAWQGVRLALMDFYGIDKTDILEVRRKAREY